MPWLISEAEWNKQNKPPRVAHKQSMQWINRYIRPGTTVAGGFLYFLIVNVLATISIPIPLLGTITIPCIMPQDLLDFDYGWVEMSVSAIAMVAIYSAMSYALSEYLMWAYVAAPRLVDLAGKSRGGHS